MIQNMIFLLFKVLFKILLKTKSKINIFYKDKKILDYKKMYLNQFIIVIDLKIYNHFFYQALLR